MGDGDKSSAGDVEPKLTVTYINTTDQEQIPGERGDFKPDEEVASSSTKGEEEIHDVNLMNLILKFLNLDYEMPEKFSKSCFHEFTSNFFISTLPSLNIFHQNLSPSCRPKVEPRWLLTFRCFSLQSFVNEPQSFKMKLIGNSLRFQICSILVRSIIVFCGSPYTLPITPEGDYSISMLCLWTTQVYQIYISFLIANSQHSLRLSNAVECL